MPTTIPLILTIGEAPAPESLRAGGSTVRHAATLLTGFHLAVRRLDQARSCRPTVILLHLQAIEPGFPELAAPQLVAVLAGQMAAGVIHPAWLIGLAPTGTPDLDAEARIAGCHHLLRPPLDDTALAFLSDEHLPPAPVPHAVVQGELAQALHAYQRAAERVLQAVQAAQIPVWTVEEAHLLLHTLTPYPLRPLKQGGMASRCSALVRALGGPRAARRRLQAIAESWQTRAPLHAVILSFFLDGLERREIVAHFVARNLYEDSRIYHCIKELPQRIAQELRIEQDDEEEL